MATSVNPGAIFVRGIMPCITTSIIGRAGASLCSIVALLMLKETTNRSHKRQIRSTKLNRQIGGCAFGLSPG